MDDDLENAALLGTGYALYRHGQDRLTDGVYFAVRAALDDWDPGQLKGVPLEPPRDAGDTVAPVELDDVRIPADWDGYIGQADLVAELGLRVSSAKVRHGRIPHMMISSRSSGMGRRTAVRVAVRQLRKKMIELSAPFTVDQLISAVDQLGYADVLYIDDLDRASGAGSVGPGTLAGLLEDRSVYSPDGVHYADEISIVASTACLDTVPSSLVDRFPVQMAMGEYSTEDLALLAVTSAVDWRCDDVLDDDLAVEVGLLCAGRGPAVVERHVLLVRDLAATLGRRPRVEEVVDAARRQVP